LPKKPKKTHTIKNGAYTECRIINKENRYKNYCISLLENILDQSINKLSLTQIAQEGKTDHA
jgi:hypothetical protein